MAQKVTAMDVRMAAALAYRIAGGMLAGQIDNAAESLPPGEHHQRDLYSGGGGSSMAALPASLEERFTPG